MGEKNGSEKAGKRTLQEATEEANKLRRVPRHMRPTKEAALEKIAEKYGSVVVDRIRRRIW